MNTTVPLWRLLLLSLLTIAFVIGCEALPPEPLPSIRIGYSPHDHHSPLYIAAMNPDYFQEHGGVYLKEIVYRQEYELVIDGEPAAKVSLNSGPGGKILIRKLAETQYDMAFGSVPAMIDFIDKGSCVKIVAPIMADGAALVLNTLLPVNNWDEFVDYVKNRPKPLRIGYKIRLCNQNLIFEYALHEAGISFSKELHEGDSDIELLNMHGSKNLLPAFENGLIDGFVVNQPLPSEAEHRGSGKIIALLSELPPKGKWQGSPCCALASCVMFYKSHRESVEALTTMIMRANMFIQKYPERAAEQIAEWLEIDVIVERRSLPTIKFMTEFDEPWHNGVDFWIKTMLDKEYLTGVVKKSYADESLKDLLYSLDLYEEARKKL